MIIIFFNVCYLFSICIIGLNVFSPFLNYLQTLLTFKMLIFAKISLKIKNSKQ